MARRLRILILVVSAIAVTPLIAQDVPAEDRGQKEADSAKSGPEFRNAKRAIEALNPEQRKRFQQNFLKWINMTPEEKSALRNREELRKKKISDEINAAVQRSGLALSQDQLNNFTKRYTVKRRKIEEQIRKEADDKRGTMVDEMITELKGEFTEDGSPGNPAKGDRQNASTKR